MIKTLLSYLSWFLLVITTAFFGWAFTTKVGGAFLMVIVSWIFVTFTGMTPTSHIWEHMKEHPTEAPGIIIESIFG